MLEATHQNTKQYLKAGITNSDIHRARQVIEV